jgi:hypothetical protein
MRRSRLRLSWICFANAIAAVSPLLNAEYFLREMFRAAPSPNSYLVEQALLCSTCSLLLLAGIAFEISLSRWASVVNVGTFAAIGIYYFRALVGYHWAAFDRSVTPTIIDTQVYPLNSAVEALLVTVVNLVFYRDVLRRWQLCAKAQS